MGYELLACRRRRWGDACQLKWESWQGLRRPFDPFDYCYLPAGEGDGAMPARYASQAVWLITSLAASRAGALSEMEAGQIEEEASEKESQQGGRVGRDGGGAAKQGPCNEKRGRQRVPWDTKQSVWASVPVNG